MIKNISIQIDVPEGATHYSVSDDCDYKPCQVIEFWKIEDNKYFFYNSNVNSWNEFIGKLSLIINFILPIVEIQND